MDDEGTTLPGGARREPDDIPDPALSNLIHRLAHPCDSPEADPSVTPEKSVIHVPTPGLPDPPLPTAGKTRRSKPAQEPGGNPAINAPLPRQGVGFVAYKGIETEYGYPETVEFVKTLAAAWADLYKKGPVLQIGDLAVQGGGPTPKMWGHPEKGYHLSHGSGRDFDVQIIAKGDVPQKPRSIDIHSEEYDQARTGELIKLIGDLAKQKLDLILTADTTFVKGKVHLDKGHTHHLHVRLQP
jgi:hypothetical protein